jgi:hypothetical protein
VRKSHTVLTCLAAFAAMAVLPASAAATQFVVGQTASPANPPITCAFSEPADEIQLGAATSPRYFVAGKGAIVSWGTFAGGEPNQSFSFKVFRKVAPFTYLVVAQDTRALTPSVLNTFPVSIPVLPGDFIGVGEPGGGVSTPCVFETGLSGDTILYAERSNTPVGGTVVFPGTAESGYRLNVSATLLPPPTISSIGPVKGSVKGTQVVVAGTNFASVSSVAFGSVPAKSFTIDSEGQITARAPASKTLASIPVTVTTAAGVATSLQTFTYEGCVVPKLQGRKLKVAKKKLRVENCRPGGVKKRGDATAKTGRVVNQSPKPGKILAPGARVKVVLGD